MNWKYFIPLGVFALLAGFLYRGLSLNPNEIPSVLIGKAAPSFTVGRLLDEQASFSTEDMKGQVWLLNVFASWCASCRDEHPFFIDMAENNVLPIIGLNYKDEPENAKAWLARFGNPYTAIAADKPGKVGIDYGVIAVPETFLIDSKGVIRYKRIGPFNAEILEKELLPLIASLQAEANS